MSGGLFRSSGSQSSGSQPSGSAGPSDTTSAATAGAGNAAGGGLFRKPTAANKTITESELYEAIDSLPSLPLVVQMILTRVGPDSKADAHDLEGLVSQDMAIATRLLKMVNSSFYALPNQVVDLGQAVAIIGFGSLKSLVLAASTAGVLSIDFPSYGFAARGLWTNSMASALLAKELAQRSNKQVKDLENYFVCGLLRDIGLLVLGPLASQKGVESMAEIVAQGDSGDDRQLIDFERERLGYDHPTVGKLVAEKWQLPEAVAMAIRYHERIPGNIDAEHHHLLATVRLADRLAARAGWGLLPRHPFSADISPKLMAACGIDEAVLKEVIIKMPEMLATAMDG